MRIETRRSVRPYRPCNARPVTRRLPREIELAVRIMRAVQGDQFSEYLRGSSSARWVVALIASVFLLGAFDVLVSLTR